MRSRREFFRNMAGASASVVCAACGIQRAAAQSGPRREVMVGGRRVKTVDVHAHAAVREVIDLVKGTQFERAARRQFEGRLGFPVGPERIADMDRDGIDVQALSINAVYYGADRDLARRIVDVQNEKLAAMCANYPDRFVGYASVSLEYPEIAADQTGARHEGTRPARRRHCRQRG